MSDELERRLAARGMPEEPGMRERIALAARLAARPVPTPSPDLRSRVLAAARPRPRTVWPAAVAAGFLLLVNLSLSAGLQAPAVPRPPLRAERERQLAELLPELDRDERVRALVLLDRPLLRLPVPRSQSHLSEELR